MKNETDGRNSLLLPVILDILVMLCAVAVPVYSAFKGGLNADMLGQLQYFYLILAVLLALMPLKDLFSTLREAKKGGKLLLGGKYLPDALRGQLVYRVMFLVLFAFVVIVRPKAGALCVLISGAAVYFTLDTRLVTAVKKPGAYENGIYFYGVFYPWEKVRSYQVRENFGTVKFNVSEEQKKLFYTGDIIVAVEDAQSAAHILAQKVKKETEETQE